MFYQLFVVGDTSIDNNPPDQPINFVPLEEFDWPVVAFLLSRVQLVIQILSLKLIFLMLGFI